MIGSAIIAARFAASVAVATAPGTTAPLVRPFTLFFLQGPQIELWTDRDYGTVYHRGDRVRLYFRTDEDAYVTVFRVDTDGRIRVLFPEDPWEDNFARGGRAYEVRQRYERYAFLVDEYPGEGYVFALATRDPFDYRAVVRGDHWDYRAIADAGRISGDPYVAFQDLADAIVPAAYDSYGYDVVSYYVEQYYEYPRFLCYDCHAYQAFPSWNPYHEACLRFRIVIYDDPYYYPARVYSATRVVYRRERRIEARYVFKDRSATDAYLVRVRQRPVTPESRRAEETAAGRSAAGAPPAFAPEAQPAPLPIRRAAPASGAEGTSPTRRPEPLGGPPPRQPETLPRQRPADEPPAIPDRGVAPYSGLRATDRPRTPTGITQPDREPVPIPRPPGQLVEPRQPGSIRPVEPERPRLERRVPPELPSGVRGEPLRAPASKEPVSAPQAKQPEAKVPAKKPPAPPKPKGER